MFLLACILALTTALSVSTADPPNTHIIPSLWCVDETTSDQCGVTPQCQAYNTSTYNQKINFTLVYWTHCGWCNIFINETLYNQIWLTSLRDSVNFDIWPYDGVKSYAGLVHACAKHHLNDMDRWFPFIHCLAERFLVEEGQKFNETLAFCFDQQKIVEQEQTTILHCAEGEMGVLLMQEYMDKGAALKPDHPVLYPWIVLGEVSSMKAQIYKDVLSLALCVWHRDDKKPIDCWLDGLQKVSREKPGDLLV